MEPSLLDLNKLFIRQLLAVSGQTFLVYDYFLTFSDELNYIWNARWTMVKAVFILNRYCNLAGQFLYTLQQLDIFSTSSQKFCFYFQWFVAVFAILSGESIRILVILRAWAVWGCTYRVAVVLVSTYLLYLSICMALTLSTMIMTFKQTLPMMVVTGTTVCTPRGAPKTWIVPLAGFLLDVFAFGMVAYPLAKLVRKTRQFPNSPIYWVLTRDALLFFSAGFATEMLSIISLTVFVNNPLAQLSIGFGLPLMTVIGQRVVLNLRGLRSQPESELIVHRSFETQVEVTRTVVRETHWDPARTRDVEFAHGTAPSVIELLDMKR